MLVAPVDDAPSAFPVEDATPAFFGSEGGVGDKPPGVAIPTDESTPDILRGYAECKALVRGVFFYATV